MANKQIKDLDLIGSNIDAASDFLIIQKADGSTYKVTVDQLINSSTTVSYGSSTGAPTVISERWTPSAGGSIFSKTITETNMFDTTSAGVLNLEVSRNVVFARGSLTSSTINHTITKTAGLNMISFGGQLISVGGPEIKMKSGVVITRSKGMMQELFIYISCTKNSLTIRSYPGINALALTGQISIVPS